MFLCILAAVQAARDSGLCLRTPGLLTVTLAESGTDSARIRDCATKSKCNIIILLTLAGPWPNTLRQACRPSLQKKRTF